MGITIGDAILWIRGNDSKLSGDLAKTRGQVVEFMDGLTTKMADIGKGASPREAFDLVMGQPGAAARQIPAGNAGNGTGDPPPARENMNAWIRLATGRR